MLPNFPILDLLQDCSDPPLTPESLEALQVKLGRRFPEEYREFLLQFNGGHFTRQVVFSLPEPTKCVTGGLMDCFFGDPNDGLDSDGLSWCVDVVSGVIPPEYLPVALCNGVDYVLLKLVGSESRFEGVWFWTFDEDQSLYWVANSFYEFLSMLVYDIFAYEGEPETQPLFQAVQRGALTAIEQYLRQGGDVEARDEHGRTLLMVALIYRWPKLVSLLLQNGVNVNARDEQGRTPLHHAAVHSVDGVKLLLAAGADATARDNEGKSVLGEWSYRGDQILRAHGARE